MFMLPLQGVITKCPELFLYLLGICGECKAQVGIIVDLDVCLDHFDESIVSLRLGVTASLRAAANQRA